MDLESRVGILEARMHDYTIIARAVELRFDAVDHRLDRMESRLDRIDLELLNIHEKIADLSSDLNSKIANLSSDLNGKIADLSSDLNGKIAKLNLDFHARITDLSTNIDGKFSHVEERITELHAQIAGIHQALSTQTRWILASFAAFMAALLGGGGIFLYRLLPILDRLAQG